MNAAEISIVPIETVRFFLEIHYIVRYNPSTEKIGTAKITSGSMRDTQLQL